MGLGTRIGAGVAALGGAAGGSVAPLGNVENNYNQSAPVNDVPAIYQNVDYKDPMEQYRNIGNVGQCAEDMAGAHADGTKGQDDDIGEQSSAARGPGYADHTDPPTSEEKNASAQESQPDIAQDTGKADQRGEDLAGTATNGTKGESTDSAPSADNGYDYYSGIC